MIITANKFTLELSGKITNVEKLEKKRFMSMTDEISYILKINSSTGGFRSYFYDTKEEREEDYKLVVKQMKELNKENVGN